MKVAVCVSGLADPDTDYLMNNLQKKFSKYDFFFGVWKGRENGISNKLNAWSFKEHEPKYHPYLDVNIPGMPPKILTIREKMKTHPEMPMIPLSVHQTKQILIHSYMLDRLPQKYDMIIRTRFDIDLSANTVDFERLVEESYNNNHATGIAITWFKKHKMFDPKNTSYHRLWEGYLMDNLILHPRKLFDKKVMMSLHKQHQLLAAEFGWYQVLSQPHGDTHQNYFCNNLRVARNRSSSKL